jgi:hypothetical protein
LSVKAKAGRRNRSFVRAEIRPTTPWMPIRRSGDENGPIRHPFESHDGLSLGLGDGHDLDGLTLAISRSSSVAKSPAWTGSSVQEKP